MLFHTDSVDELSDFSQLIDELDIMSIRYPGGTISEQFFDLNDPEIVEAQNFFDLVQGNSRIETRSVLPLSEFLHYVRSIAGTPTIVLPTYRYFDQNTRTLSTEGISQIKGFIRNIMSGEFGSIFDVTFEIGNEWYQDNFNWSAEEFGRFQAEMAGVINETLEQLGVRDNVNILAQSGQTSSEVQILASFFNNSSGEHIDGVLTHLYGTNSSGNPLGIGGGVRKRLDEISTEWGNNLGDDFLLAVTEWNIGESGEDTTQINGIMRFAPLLRLFAEMISSGVDIAHIWSAQTNGPAGLSDREGEGNSLSPTGHLFDLISGGTIGTKMVDNGSSFQLRDSENSVVGYNYSFVGENHAAIYFVSGVEEILTLNADLSAFQIEGAFIYLTVLSGNSPDGGTEYWSSASTSYITELPLSQDGDWNLIYDLGAYELVQIHISHDVGITIDADSYNAIDDYLTGTNFSDRLLGQLGDDTLVGNSGNDHLSGGDGIDQLFGGVGHDTLTGGGGDDQLHGEHGRDSLEGDGGNDFLSGGKWHDTLSGGDGDDTIWGGDGNDIIFPGNGFGSVNGGLGTDVLSFSDIDYGISLWGSEQLVEVGFAEFGFPVLSYEEVEIIEGTNFGDRFEIIHDGMTFRGLEGNDTFDIYGGDQIQIDMGAGDDSVFIMGPSQADIYGGPGDDLFFTTVDESRFSGQEGNDEFYLFGSRGNIIEFGLGHDHDAVTNFNPAHDTLVILDTARSDLEIAEDQFGIYFTLSDGSSITLNDVYISDEFDYLSFG
jgi:Ca2+-binding RTX toxin-like protein